MRAASYVCVMQGYDVAGYHVRGLVLGFRALGLDTEQLLQEAAIERRALEDPEARFGELQLLMLWLSAEQRDGKPAFGLRLARAIPFGKLELVDYLVGTCPSLGAGLECLERHARLCSSGFYFRLERGAGTVMYLEHRLGVALLPRSLVEYLWVILIARLREACGPAFEPALSLRCEPQGPAGAYRDVLGRAPQLGAADAMFVPEAQWQLANPRRDATLARLLEAHVRDVNSRLPSDDFQTQARQLVADALHAGDPAMQRVAARMGLSARTLQRRLEEANTSFVALVDQVRRELALRYLSDTQLSLTEISNLLAYAEPSAFGRAFRRWTGQTPASYRDRQPLGRRGGSLVGS